jgi:hypothetical protein
VPEFHHTDPQSIRDHAHRLDDNIEFNDWPELALALHQYEQEAKLRQEILVVVRCEGGFFVAWVPDAAAYYHYRGMQTYDFEWGYYAVERGEVLSNVVPRKIIKEWRPFTNRQPR